MNKQKWTELLIFIVAAELVGVLSGIVAGNTNSFYQELAKPPLSPPGWVFPVVWAVLYALMGWSAYLIAAAKVSTSEKGCALFLYGLQLLVNFMWSIVFFRLEKLGGSRYSGFARLADWHAAAVSENSAACGMAESALFVLDGVCLLFKHWNLDAESLTGFLSVRRRS